MKGVTIIVSPELHKFLKKEAKYRRKHKNYNWTLGGIAEEYILNYGELLNNKEKEE